MHFQTKAIHAGRERGIDGPFDGPSYPLYLTSTFHQDSHTDAGEFLYTRSGNPTRDNLEKQVAALEESKYALAMASGMAAVTVSLSLLEPGDKVLFHEDIYGGTWSLLEDFLATNKIGFQIVRDLNEFDFADLDPAVKAVFIETPSNPLNQVTDIESVANKAKEHNLLVIVDNTFMTSYLQKPLQLGADIVVYSATKYYGGHSDVISGLITVNDEELYDKLKLFRKVQGSPLSPFDAFLTNRGIKTMPIRMDAQEKNTAKIFEYFRDSNSFDAVYYTGDPSRPDYEIQKKQATGFGGLISVELNEDYDLNVFTSSLRVFALAVSLGGVESLMSVSATMTHETYTQEQHDSIGIKPNLIRIAIGIEHIDDLIGDIEQALEKSKK